MQFLGNDIFLSFWIYTLPQWILNQTLKIFPPWDDPLGFTAATFSCSVFVGLPSVWYLITENHALLGWRIFSFFARRNSGVAFALCFRSSSICTVKCRLIAFAGFEWIWVHHSTIQNLERLLLSADPVPLTAVHAIAWPPQFLTEDVVQIMSSFSPSP